MSEAVVPAPVPPAPTRSELVVDGLREPGLDLTAARARVEASASARRRRGLLGVLGGLAALGLAVAAFVLVGQRGDDVASTADATSTSTTAPAPTTIPEAIPVAPVTTSSTVPAAAGVAPPVDPVSLSPLGAQLSVSRNLVVGAPFTLAIDWNDADHAAAGDPSVEVEWNDPFLAAAAAEPRAAACGTSGAPRAGRIERTFRYSTPGERTIVVRLRTCDGSGPLAEDVRVELPVEVVGQDGASLVAATDPAAGDPDAASATRYDASSGGAQTLANRSDAVDQVLRRDRSQRATVLVATGPWTPGDVVLLQFPDGACRWAALGSSGSASAAVLTQQGCQPERPTTTTVPPSTSSSTTSTVPEPTSTTSP